ncbi:MAG: manganese catalase family protein, partial [Bradymonadaceae bacterium]
KESKEEFIHQAVTNPQFLNLSGGGVSLTDSNGNPWTSQYVTANGDLTVDLRSHIAAESRTKIVYEYLMQFTDDPEVKGTLQFLMSREIAHFRQFHAALEEIQPNFPPGVLQGDPDFNQTYFNISNGEDVRSVPSPGSTWRRISPTATAPAAGLFGRTSGTCNTGVSAGFPPCCWSRSRTGRTRRRKSC